MIKSLKRSYYMSGAAMTMGALALAPSTAQAAAAEGFNTLAKNVVTGTESLPGLITAMSYLAGTLLAVLGVMKIKDHVENPTQTPLKDGAIRLIAGGMLFALPMVMEAMQGTIGEGTAIDPAKLNKVKFETN